MMEIVITNTGGLTTLISAITNLIIAVPFEIGFLQFFIISAPLAVLLFFVSMYMSKRLFIFPSTDISDEKREKIESYNEWNFVSNPRQFKLTSAIFVGTMLLFLISDIIHFEIAVISVGGGVLMAFSSKKDLDKILPKLDWTLLTFFISLFILIKGLELMGLMILIKKFLLAILGSNVIVGGVLILIFSSVMSGILDNLVLAAALTPVLLDISSESPGLKMGPLVWALIFGTNLGGGLTPIGAPPGVLGLGILYRETGEKVGWGEFFKTIGVITLVRILISAIYVVLIGLLLPDSFTIGIPRPS